MLLACALLATPVIDVSAAASPTLVRAQGSPSSGGPGTTISYKYTWDFADCANNSKEADPSHLRVVLAWDDSATTPIGFATVMTSAAQFECQGTVSAAVPANATAGDHFPQAYLEDPNHGDEVVPNSNTGKVFAGQQVTVVLPPTPTPAATPSPTPTDTPLPTDTPSDVTFSAAPSPTGSGATTVPVAAGNGGSGPPAALVAVVALVVLVAAVVAAAALMRRRRARSAEADPFEFLR